MKEAYRRISVMFHCIDVIRLFSAAQEHYLFVILLRDGFQERRNGINHGLTLLFQQISKLFLLSAEDSCLGDWASGHVFPSPHLHSDTDAFLQSDSCLGKVLNNRSAIFLFAFLSLFKAKKKLEEDITSLQSPANAQWVE